MLLIHGFYGIAFSNLTEIRLEEKKFAFVPQMQLLLPNAVIDIFMEGKIINSKIKFASKYDFIDNYIDTNLGFQYNFSSVFAGIGLSDKIDFEQVYSNQSYLQRSKYYETILGYIFSKHIEIKTSIKYENTSSASIDTLLIHDRGRNVTGNIELSHNSLDENPTLPTGQKYAINFTRSYDVFGSEYDYTQSEIEAVNFSYPFGNNYFKTKIKIGYPVAIIKKPLTSVYFAGGYDIMRGYSLKQFYGNSLIYVQLNHHIPFMLKKAFSDNALEIITGDITFETCKIGEKEIFDTAENIKSSFGIGSTCYLKLFKNVNLRFNLSINQAVDSTNPIYYFTFNTFSYIINKETNGD